MNDLTAVVTAIRRRSVWWRAGIVGLGALLGACGPAGNTGEPPGPSASPGSTRAGFLHVLQGQSITTYQIDGVTGQLLQTATQELADARTLTGDPQGRFVYAARSPKDGWYVGEHDPLPTGYIVALAPDPKTGSLTAVSEASSQPGFHNQFHASGGWVWLSATSTRVYALWEISTSHIYSTYMTYAVGSDGQLGPGHLELVGESNAAVDADSGVLYSGDREYSDIPLRAYTLADGRLTRSGSSELCGGSILYGGIPLVAVNGWLLASGHAPTYSTKTVCSYEGPQLVPRADLGLNDSARAAVAVVPRTVFPLATDLTGGATAALVAMQFADPKGLGPYEVRLFRMDGNGGLELLDRVEGRGTLLFHPSGRFLYLSSTSGLKVFAITGQNQLELIQALGGGEGAMAVTLPS